MSDTVDNTSDIAELEWLDPAVLASANIVPATGLATDYLNVFNEAVMLFGLLPDMPDMIDELLVWEPLTYEQHFRRSGFQAKELAILAYQNAKPHVKEPFDTLSKETCLLLQTAVLKAHQLITTNQDVSHFVAQTTVSLQAAIMTLDAMVHGGNTGGAQNDIDAMFD